MIPRKLLSLFLTFWLSQQAHSQLVTEFQWQNTLGSYFDDILTTVIPLPDGRIFVGGTSNSVIGFDKSEHNVDCCYDDYWILMLDSAGNKLWDSVYGGSIDDQLISALLMPDGGFLLVGHSRSEAGHDRTAPTLGNYDYWLVRVDSMGAKLWDVALGGNKNDYLTDVLMTDDQEILLVGYSSSEAGLFKDENPKGGADDRDFWIVLIDTLGNLQWENTIGGNNYDEAAGAVQTADGGFLIVGRSESGVSADKSDPFHGEPGSPAYDYWLVKTGPGGNVQWDKTIGGDEDDIPTGILDCGDDTYLLYGYSTSSPGYEKTEINKGMEDYWLLHVDASGNILWDKTIGGIYSDVPNAVVRVSEDQYLLGGWTISPLGYDKHELAYGGEDMWLVSIDSSGQFQWGDGIGCSDDEAITAIFLYSDSSILVAGYSASDTCMDKTELNKSDGDNAPDYFLFRLDPYQFLQVYGSDYNCVDETFLLPWGEETDTFGVFVDTLTGDILDTIHQFELEPVLIEDSIVDYTYYADLYDCDSDAEYTWIDCVTGEPIDWSDGCSFWVYEDGYYGVVIEKEGCIDTSACLLLFAGAVTNPNLRDVLLYPNPGDGIININAADAIMRIRMYDLYGREVQYTWDPNASPGRLTITSAPPGIYTIIAATSNGSSIIQYVKYE